MYYIYLFQIIAISLILALRLAMEPSSIRSQNKLLLDGEVEQTHCLSECILGLYDLEDCTDTRLWQINPSLAKHIIDSCGDRGHSNSRPEFLLIYNLNREMKNNWAVL